MGTRFLLSAFCLAVACAQPLASAATILLSFDDTSVRENDPLVNFRAFGELPIAGSDTGFKARSLILPDLSPITTPQIAQATLTLTKIGTWNQRSPFPTNHVINVVPVTSSWSLNTVTWAAQPTYGALVSATSASTSDPHFTTYNFDVTPLVNQWLAGTVTPRGLALIVATEGSHHGNQYGAEESANDPVLTVVVPEPAGAAGLLGMVCAAASLRSRARRRRRRRAS